MVAISSIGPSEASSRLNTIHNLHFYLDLMKRVREALVEDRWEEFRDFCLTRFAKRG